MHKFALVAFATTSSLVILLSSNISGATDHSAVSDEAMAAQRHMLAKNTDGAGFGPQAPRDIDAVAGSNPRVFEAAPVRTKMNLCNIHFHENAEHKGGEFTTYAGNGDGNGFGTGYKYNGDLTAAELAPFGKKVGASANGDLEPGDTIEVDYVFTTAKVKPGPTLASCFSEAINNPQLRVEAQIYVLVNDDNARDFRKLTHHEVVNGLHQATNIPSDTGTPVQYAGSTTGPDFNQNGSPFQVTWNVRPLVAKVSIATIDAWLQGNVFKEDSAHGARNLVVNPELLSEIKR